MGIFTEICRTCTDGVRAWNRADGIASTVTACRRSDACIWLFVGRSCSIRRGEMMKIESTAAFTLGPANRKFSFESNLESNQV